MPDSLHLPRMLRQNLLCIIAVTLGGCGVVDQYGPRATAYNQEASSSKSSNILLNIMRAAYRQPLQFTDMSTVTGTASAGATASTTNPFQIGGTPFTMPETVTFTPTVSISGGPNFNIANLNTQEFYQGIQAPIEPQILANYVSEGIPLKVLLPLFVSDIELDDKRENKKYHIHNSALTEASFANFLTAMNGLVKQGLSIESEATSEGVGPVLTAQQASDPRLLAGLVQATSSASGNSALSLSGVKDGNSVSKSKFQLNKPGSKWHFCFNNPTRQPFAEDALTISALKPISAKRQGNLQYSGGLVSIKFPIEKNDLCGQTVKKDSANGKQQVTPDLKFTMRSVEGIFFYLGEMTRAELALDRAEPEDLDDPNGGPSLKFPVNDQTAGPRSLFKVLRGRPNTNAIAATISGESFYISADPSGSDTSEQVVELLTDLLALKSSAKNLPAPNVISVVP